MFERLSKLFSPLMGTLAKACIQPLKRALWVIPFKCLFGCCQWLNKFRKHQKFPMFDISRLAEAHQDLVSRLLPGPNLYNKQKTVSSSFESKKTQYILKFTPNKHLFGGHFAYLAAILENWKCNIYHPWPLKYMYIY